VEWVRFSALERTYGARRIFGNVSGVLRDGVKAGLVGPNGSGKSSLVRILAGVDTPDAGELARARDSRAGYVSQVPSGDQAATLRAILGGAFARIAAEEAHVRDLERQLSAAAEAGDAERQERALRAYGEARESFDRHGGEGLERRMRSMLAAFGFGEDDLERPLDEFSGGQRTRVALARVFLEEPDYLILDEPTNHLDLDMVRWLEDFLLEDPRATLVVSHDRYFIDRVANEIWELEGNSLERYEVPAGSAYTAYVAEKTHRAELAQREYEQQLAEEKRRKAVVAELRTHGSHNYSQVRSREKQLAKLAPVVAPNAPRKAISVKLEAARRATTGLALEVRAVSKAYAKPLFTSLSFDLRRGERLGIVGANGSGKSTLLEILGGRGRPDSGVVRVPEGVRSAYFAQDAADDLRPGQSAAEAVLEGAAILPQEARALLGRLGLGDEAGEKAVEDFSGGERRRIMLARLMARAADCLFLDEPTNDLDIPSREALESVLASYGGALVIVSHDRYLLRRTTDRVLWLHDGEATMFENGFAQFEARSRISEPETAPRPAQKKELSPQELEREARLAAARRQRELVACELEVARLDAERARIEREFADPAIYDDQTRVATLRAELERAQKALDEGYGRWERLVNAHDGVETNA